MKKQLIYTYIWKSFKRFPRFLHQGSKEAPKVNGSAAAALISGGIGAAVMMIAHHLSDTSKDRENFLRNLGSWIPGSISTDPMWGNIGSYAGKETVFLIAWLVSWIVLHYALKNTEIKAKTLFFWMFTLFTLATAMSWHPLFPYLPLM